MDETKKRKWIKVHAAVDPKSGECLSISVTDETPRSVQKAYADGAYDTLRCREKLYERGIEDIIPPRKTAKLRSERPLYNRNKGVKELQGLKGDYKLWKLLKGYGRLWKAEPSRNFFL